MPESDRTVKCPICDEGFDPTVAGGWCTNPDCGEWQHTNGTETPEPTEFVADDDGPEAADLIVEGTDETNPSTDADAATQDAGESVDVGEDTEPSQHEAGADEHATPDDSAQGDTADHGGEQTTEDRGSSAAEDGASATDTEDATTETGTGTDDATTEDHQTEPLAEEDTDDTGDPATIHCPDCDTELAPDANFCVECGANVQDVTPADDVLDACPSCDTEVDETDSFCVNCGEDLDAHRGAATTDATPDAADTNGTATGTNGAGTAAETMAAQASDTTAVPERLVLSVEGRDITVEDGDRIGREIRAALLDAGRPEDEAVRIHREHVRFDRQPDGFYLVDLGDNPTRLNGTALKKGDREPIQQGDELELSGVVTMTIEAK